MESNSNLFDAQATIKVLGVGGAGGNAVNRMVLEGVDGVDFVALNTDAQVLNGSLADHKIQIGSDATRGLGAGGDPETGAKAAAESERAISEAIEGSDMIFITAGMGGGTGSGAAPIVAEMARRKKILTVGVVTKPFAFEGAKRRKVAEQASLRLAEHVDTLIIVPNDRLLEIVDRRASVQEAFAAADDVLRQGVQGISDIITKAGLINVDFADVRSVMTDAGAATMGMGRAQGEHRARLAAEMAANSPLLETGLFGAKKLLVNITTGPDFSLGEVYDAMEFLQQFVDSEEAEIFMGHVLDPKVGDEVQVTVLAAGMNRHKRVADTAVFREQEQDRVAEDRHVAAVRIRESGPTISMDELDLDISSFLRSQKSGN